MSIFRKVQIRVHRDARIRSLSQPTPNGKSLWMWLLTSPLSISIPGIVIGSESVMAAEIGWPVSGFRKAREECSNARLIEVCDGFIWLRKALRQEENHPQNPNVVRSWAKVWGEVPEYPLKVTVYETLEEVMTYLDETRQSKGKGYLITLRESFDESYRESIDQSPEHQNSGYRIQDTEPRTQEPPISPKGDCAGDFAAFWTAYPRKVGKTAARKAWGRAKPPLPEVLAALDWQKRSEDWTKDGGRFIPHPATYLNQGRWEDEKPAANLTVTKPPEPKAWAELRRMVGDGE